MKKNFFICFIPLFFAACAGNANKSLEEKLTVQTAPEKLKTTETPEIKDSLVVQINQQENLISQESKPQANLSLDTNKNLSEQNVLDGEKQESKIKDPYIEFPALAEQVFLHADTLYKQGFIDSATAYLERFRIIKPLWNQWESHADSLLNEYGKIRANKAKAFEPLVMQIQNMNRAQAAYSLVLESVDSLLSLSPGDSLVIWANYQKEIAYKNTLEKAKKEYATIKSLALDQAQFAKAQEQALVLQMRYRDFEDSLHIQVLINEIQKLAQANDSIAASYWEKNDPAIALLKVDSLLKTEKFEQAKILIEKLKASKLRKEAVEKYQELADVYCTQLRKKTSQIFSKAQKQKDAEKKRTLLQEAIAPLEKCLAEYPEYSQKQKVIENKEFLQKEIKK